MSDDLYERLVKLSPERLALLALEQQERLQAVEEQAGQGSSTEAVAIIGMGCRLPGAPDPESYWELLRDGGDAIREIGPDRWNIDEYYDPDPDVPGRMATRWAGLLDDIDRFDPQFFGISPREARTLDPQQRVLLEVAWEALENAGIAPDSLSGSATGSYVGLCNADYAQLLLQGDARNLDMYLSTGNADSVASGRLSYVLGLQGPALTVDTACSSSLVATHLAVQALRAGDCDMALAGGVNIILSPKTTITLSQAKMMAADGRCKAFDSRADGFVRGEGCGLIVLKRLSVAEADGDRILAVIRGSAVNQDGRSNGLTAPNGPSQVAVLRAALADAEVEPGAIGYVEAHGTGTSLGDPIEAQSLGTVLGPGRGSDDRLMIGSAKTNLGHLESAAGVAGLLKVVLSMQHGEVPPSLHLQEPNPYIPWDRLPIDVVTERRPWPADGRALAGVSSFGFSGTNAHIILEPAEADRPAPTDGAPIDGAPAIEDRPLHLVPISAAAPAALDELVAGYGSLLAQDPPEATAGRGAGHGTLADVAATAALGRSHQSERLAIVAADRAEAQRLLAAARSAVDLADRNLADHDLAEQLMADHDGAVAVGRASSRTPKVAFLFTGHGSQYPAMGAELYRNDPAYRSAMDECASLLEPELGTDITAEIEAAPGSDGSHPLDRMTIAQPAVFALEYSLATMWRSWGVEPDVVVGHSVGEYVAAVVAGVMSLEDGLRLVSARGRLMDTLPAGAAMASILASEPDVLDAISATGLAVHIAAVNGPRSVAVSGDPGSVAALSERFQAQGVDVRPLKIPVAAHSPQVDPILDEFERIAATVDYHRPTIDIISGRTGRPADGEDLVTARYWRDHLRQPVRFADAFGTVHDRGIRVFVETGPHPTLLNMGRHIVPDAAVDPGTGDQPCTWLPSLRSGHDDWRIALGSLARLYTLGASIDWAAVVGGRRRPVTLPSYPFQRDRYWATAPDSITTHGGNNPLLGRAIDSPAIDVPVFETELGATWPEWLDDHRIHGISILPSPAILAMAMQAATSAGLPCDTVERFAIREALILPDEGHLRVQTVLRPDENGFSFEVLSKGHSSSDWTVHASGDLRRSTEEQQPTFDPAARQGLEEIDGGAYYDRLAALGLGFGETFRGLRTIWADDGQAFGLIEPSEGVANDRASYDIHPALLDACMHLIGGPGDVRGGEQVALLIGMERFRQIGPWAGTGPLWCRVVLRQDAGTATGSFEADLRVQGDDGTLVAVAEGVHLRLADRNALRRTSGRHLDDRVYGIEWVPFEGQASTGEADEQATVDEHLDALAVELPTRAEDAAVPEYLAFVDGLEQLATAYGHRAIRLLGDEAVIPRHRQVVARLRALLSATANGDGAGPEELLAALRARYPDHGAEIGLVERCGHNLADVFRGSVEPLELLFPGGDQTDTERLYRDTPIARVANDLVADAVRRLAAAPRPGPIRILEVGAGTGATTDAVLAALHRAGVSDADYVFTDVGPLFVTRAAERFAGPNARGYDVRCTVLDIENDFGPQGIDGGFDVVIAANVVHATADLGNTLARLRTATSEGGALVLLESVQETIWVTTTFGLTEGWWRFTDSGRRPDHPLLGHQAWPAALTDAGFATARSITPGDGTVGHAPGDGSVADIAVGDIAGQSIFVARATESEPPEGDTPADLIVGSPTPLRGELTALIEETGRDVITVDPGTAPAAVAEHLRAETPIGRLIVLADEDGAPAATAADAMTEAGSATATLLATTKAVVETESTSRVWVVTRGAQPADGPVTAPHLAAVWGLGRVISLEHPGIWGGSIDLPPSADSPDGTTAPADAASVLAAISTGGTEDQFALRDGGMLVPRLNGETSLPDDPTEPAGPADAGAIEADGTYLVTGGLGGLGLQVAHWLCEQGAGAIMLTGRRGLPPRDRWPTPGPDGSDGSDLPADTRARIETVRRLESSGTTVVVEAVDIGDHDAMSALVGRCGTSLPPLKGVIHCAAALSNHGVTELTTKALDEMLHPKVAGTWTLDAVTADQPLKFVVLFSSTTALWGSAGLAHYSAANAVLDAYAQYKRTSGGPWISVNWGTWDEMRAASVEEQTMVERGGLHAMPSEDALEQLQQIIAAKPVQIAIVDADWKLLKPLYETRRPRPFLSLVGTDDAQSDGAPGGGRQAELANRLADTPVEQHAAVIEEFLTTEVARALQIADPHRIDIYQGLFDMGMDSLMSVELKGRIDRALGVTLPSTLTFNYPTVADLTGYLLESVAAGQAGAEQSTPTATAPIPPAAAPEPVADDLDEDELESLLADRLTRLQDRLGDGS